MERHSRLFGFVFWHLKDILKPGKNILKATKATRAEELRFITDMQDGVRLWLLDREPEVAPRKVGNRKVLEKKRAKLLALRRKQNERPDAFTTSFLTLLDAYEDGLIEHSLDVQEYSEVPLNHEKFKTDIFHRS